MSSLSVWACIAPPIPRVSSSSVPDVYAPWRHYADDTMYYGNPGGSDAAAVVAWQVEFNQNDGSLGLLDYDLMSMYIEATIHLRLDVLS